MRDILYKTSLKSFILLSATTTTTTTTTAPYKHEYRGETKGQTLKDEVNEQKVDESDQPLLPLAANRREAGHVRQEVG
ncbi:hypothetical protein E2C01_052379 [Portunus trituberculatus]|uniref:Uncharacterized protein n=1 Tax=Portunus trituberculatus TaxID=210409 RepID=A0A5B7GMB2_PORTR|nr:hypothetical protein [Portunus trituberculatus]